MGVEVDADDGESEFGSEVGVMSGDRCEVEVRCEMRSRMRTRDGP